MELGRIVREESALGDFGGAELGKYEVEPGAGPVVLERMKEARLGLVRGWCLSGGRKSNEGGGRPDWRSGFEL